MRVARPDSSKDNLTARLRAYLDREPIAKIRKLLQRGGKIAFDQSVIEFSQTPYEYWITCAHRARNRASVVASIRFMISVDL